MITLDIEIVQESLHRVDDDPALLSRFYDRFIGHSEDIAALFRHTDMAGQRRALEGSLYTTLLAVEGLKWAVTGLRELGRHHDELGIPDDYYDVWVDCLIETFAECDPEWSPELADAWRRVFIAGIAIMRGNADVASNLGAVGGEAAGGE